MYLAKCFFQSCARSRLDTDCLAARKHKSVAHNLTKGKDAQERPAWQQYRYHQHGSFPSLQGCSSTACNTCSLTVKESWKVPCSQVAMMVIMHVTDNSGHQGNADLLTYSMVTLCQATLAVVMHAIGHHANRDINLHLCIVRTCMTCIQANFAGFAYSPLWSCKHMHMLHNC